MSNSNVVDTMYLLDDKITGLVGQRQFETLPDYAKRTAIFDANRCEDDWDNPPEVEEVLTTAIHEFVSNADTCGIRTELLATLSQATSDKNQRFKPLSAEATSITTMGNNEDAEFFQETKPIESDFSDDIPNQPELPERSQAEVAADFANQFLMHRHRGVINCDSYFVIFGNDGWETDQRSRKELADDCGKLRHHEPDTGLSGDKMTWAVVLTDHSRSLFDEEELEHLVWDTWMEVCDGHGQRPVDSEATSEGVLPEDSIWESRPDSN